MNQKKNILLAVLIVGVISMTVAFAALSTNLKIQGSANVAEMSWNIHFQNWALDTESTVNGHTNTAVYPTVSELTKTLSPNITKVEGVNVTLSQPGDYAKYTFEIINEGTIDAELNAFTHTMTCGSGNTCSDVINYEVKCYENSSYTGTEVSSSNHSVITKNGGLAYCYLLVEYKDKTNGTQTAGTNQRYEQTAITTTLEADWSWVQSTQGNSGNNGGGNTPTPSNPDYTTFNGTYGYDFPGAATSGNGGETEWVSTLDPDAKMYYRYTGTEIEVCGVFGTGQEGTVCVTPSLVIASDFEDCPQTTQTYTGTGTTCLKGYSKNKADEMLAKGATSCSIRQGDTVDCENSFCEEDPYGEADCVNLFFDQNYVEFPTPEGNWGVRPDGSTGFHSAP